MEVTVKNRHTSYVLTHSKLDDFSSKIVFVKENCFFRRRGEKYTLWMKWINFIKNILDWKWSWYTMSTSNCTRCSDLELFCCWCFIENHSSPRIWVEWVTPLVGTFSYLITYLIKSMMTTNVQPESVIWLN